VGIELHERAFELHHFAFQRVDLIGEASSCRAMVCKIGWSGAGGSS
jgi:hypothetical protein